MILCCLSLAGNLEAELENIKQKLFQLYGFSSARLLPAIVPLALFESRPDSAYNLSNKIHPPAYLSTDGIVCTETLIYIEVVEKATLLSLSSRLQQYQEEAYSNAHHKVPAQRLLKARGCFLALNEESKLSPDRLSKEFPISNRRLRFLSVDLIELRFRAEREWWKSVEWEIIDRNYIGVKK